MEGKTMINKIIGIFTKPYYSLSFLEQLSLAIMVIIAIVLLCFILYFIFEIEYKIREKIKRIKNKGGINNWVKKN